MPPPSAARRRKIVIYAVHCCLQEAHMLRWHDGGHMCCAHCCGLRPAQQQRHLCVCLGQGVFIPLIAVCAVACLCLQDFFEEHEQMGFFDSVLHQQPADAAEAMEGADAPAVY